MKMLQLYIVISALLTVVIAGLSFLAFLTALAFVDGGPVLSELLWLSAGALFFWSVRAWVNRKYLQIVAKESHNV